MLLTSIKRFRQWLNNNLYKKWIQLFQQKQSKNYIIYRTIFMCFWRTFRKQPTCRKSLTNFITKSSTLCLSGIRTHNISGGVHLTLSNWKLCIWLYPPFPFVSLGCTSILKYRHCLARQWLAASRLFSEGSPVSSTYETNHHDIAEILLKVALNTITHIVHQII
jgi:hypothetical protein